MATNKISSLWTNFTTEVTAITKVQVAWETIAREVFQLTPEETIEGVISPATYRLSIYPVDLNDLGAATADVEAGYLFMDYFGQIFTIIDVDEINKTIDVADVLSYGYCPPSGRPGIIYSTSTTTKPVEIINSRWVETDLACTLDIENNNTGEQTGWSKKQIKNKATGVWEYTGEQIAILRTNTSSCPPPAPDPYRVSISVGTTSYNMATDTNVGYSSNSEVDFFTPIYPGSNRLFLSIPVAKSLLLVKNAMGINITNKFDLTLETDNRTGYQPNKVYKGKTVFFTDDYPIQFTIKVS